MENGNNGRIGREESLNSKRQTTAVNGQQSPPTSDGIETDPDEPSSWEGDSNKRKETEPAPDAPAGPNAMINDESRTHPGVRGETSSSRKRRRQTEPTTTSSSSGGDRSESVSIELSQRSENQLEMNRTIVRLKSLQRQMALVTEQYMAKMAHLQEQQEKCSAMLWQRQQLQGELRAKYAEAVPQEMSSNGQHAVAFQATRSEQASNRGERMQCRECGDRDHPYLMCPQRPTTHSMFQFTEEVGETHPARPNDDGKDKGKNESHD